MINNKHKFIFIHIPKNGGSSIESLLGCITGMRRSEYIYWDKELNHWHQHLYTSEILGKKKYRNTHDYYKFTFVRNPWDRLVSEIAWRYKTSSRTKFKEIVKSILPYKQKIINKKRDIQRHLDEQYKYVLNESGQCIVNYIGKFENIQKDFNIICNNIGLPQLELPHKNDTTHKHYTEYYDDETRDLVARKYIKDIELFEYEYGD